MEVILIGKGPGKELAPKKGDGLPTWGVNDVVAVRECDVCFWMDRHLLKDAPMDRLVTNAVNHTKTPMYSAKMWDDIPTCIVYPRDDIFNYLQVKYTSFQYHILVLNTIELKK